MCLGTTLYRLLAFCVTHLWKIDNNNNNNKQDRIKREVDMYMQYPTLDIDAYQLWQEDTLVSV